MTRKKKDRSVIISMGRSFCGIRRANIETSSEDCEVTVKISFHNMRDKFRFVRIISELIEKIDDL